MTLRQNDLLQLDWGYILLLDGDCIPCFDQYRLILGCWLHNGGSVSLGLSLLLAASAKAKGYKEQDGQENIFFRRHGTPPDF
jgi:hypothetical protein